MGFCTSTTPIPAEGRFSCSVVGTTPPPKEEILTPRKSIALDSLHLQLALAPRPRRSPQRVDFRVVSSALPRLLAMLSGKQTDNKGTRKHTNPNQTSHTKREGSKQTNIIILKLRPRQTICKCAQTHHMRVQTNMLIGHAIQSVALLGEAAGG